MPAATLDFKQQATVPNLPRAYISSSPADLKDGLRVGRLALPGSAQAIEALRKADANGQFANLDSLLIWKDGKMVFEMYARRGRVDAPHYAMSITKTLTSMALGRALQLGHLKLSDLDRPVIEFMPAINRKTIQPGVETITLQDALIINYASFVTVRRLHRVLKLDGSFGTTPSSSGREGVPPRYARIS